MYLTPGFQASDWRDINMLEYSVFYCPSEKMILFLIFLLSPTLACNNFLDYCDEMEHHLGNSSDFVILLNIIAIFLFSSLEKVYKVWRWPAISS